MLRHHLLRLFALSLLALGSLLAPPASGGPLQGGPNLGDEIRAGIRWLRASQDAATGAYGGGVAGTSWALRAFAECPDQYRFVDGPFVKKAALYLISRQSADGAIADPGAQPEAALEQTRLAAAALTLFAGPETASALKAALQKLGPTGLVGPGWEAPRALENAAAAEQRAGEILAARDEDGLWVGKDGSTIETARALVELSRCEREVRKAARKSQPGRVEPLPATQAVDAARADKALLEGGKFLASLAPDGRFGQPGKPDAGVSALALGALLCVPAPRPPEVQKAIDGGLAWLVSLQHQDGSIHDGKLANYGTSAAIMALARAGRAEHAPVIAKARAYLQGLQADEGEGYSEGDLYYGGIGYGGAERPDLSNLQMALEALSASGLKSGDPSYAKALHFLQRCQNRSETNDVRIPEGRDGKVVIVSGNDGGAGYAPGDSKAGFEKVGDTQVPRSYGSMTYALLKSLVFAGLDKQDPRVQAAWKWCREHYTLDINPGFVASEDPTAPYQGLYYYLHTLARALQVMDEDVLVDGTGKSHNWRAEVCGRVVAMQDRTDGSWTNRNSPRWYEGNPVVATAYALLTLDAARPR
jgi:squalene-hopene/tetraprenyl-beta-curcumene cyclase